MTVQEWFEIERIDLDFLEEMEDINFYWQSSVNFITENWRKQVEDLSPKQSEWATKILDDCTEKRINGKHYV